MVAEASTRKVFQMVAAAAKKSGKAKGKSSVKLAVSKSSAKRIKAQKEAAVPQDETHVVDVPVVSDESTPATEAPATEAPPTELQQLQAEVTRLTTELSLRDKLKIQITEESILVDRAASEVLSCESTVEEAKGDLKAAKERYDKRVNALRDLVRDMAVGQGRLDFENSTPQQMQTALVTAAATALDPATTASVSELGKKKLKEIVGAEEFDRAKAIDDPIGLTDGQVEAIEGDGCLTIADLIKKLKDYPLFLQDLKGFGEKAQGRLSMSLAAWRKVNPEPVATALETDP